MCIQLDSARSFRKLKGLDSLKNPDGTFTDSQQEDNDILLSIHFPGCKVATAETNIIETLGITRRYWHIVSKVVTEKSNSYAFSTFDNYKSLGPDGFSLESGIDIIVKNMKPMLKAGK